MLRGIAAIILGYVVILVSVMIAMAVAWLALGASFAFEEGTTEVTLVWIAVVLPLSFIGALVGGAVARRIARGNSKAPVEMLAGLVLITGFLTAVATQRRDVERLPPEQLAAIGVLEAAAKARQPAWFSFLIPFVGALGVRSGGRSRRKHRTRPPT